MAETRCKDCKALPPEQQPRNPRPAKNPGPRCATHYREFRLNVKRRAHATRVAQVYGLINGDYERIYRWQNGVCYICQRATGATRKLSVDHCHKTGLVRGLLCRPCNDMLGHARDDPEFFGRAITYLTLPPAQQAGIMRHGALPEGVNCPCPRTSCVTCRATPDTG